MKILICAPHQWPIPTPAHTGHIVILDLAIALAELGHDVTMIAPEGTAFPRVLPIACSNGTAEPSAEYAEIRAIRDHESELLECDVIHDWSCEKHFAQCFPEKSVTTLLSGHYDRPSHGRNVVVWTEEMRWRALRGESDYFQTEFPEWDTPTRPLRDVRVCYGGVDTDFWTPFGDGDWTPLNKNLEAIRDIPFLWLGRWHPARGYKLAIELAKRADIELVMAGEHPDDCLNSHQRECAIEAERLAAGVARVHWLPRENHREAVRNLYRRARCYLFTPLFREPFGLSQVEAMACGAPVIATPLGSTREVVGFHGGCVSTVGSGVDALMWSLRYLENGAEFAPSARIRDSAVSRFSRRTMATRMVELYKECLAGGWG